MKRTIKTILISVFCLVSCIVTASADNDKLIQVNALPAKAQTLLTQHFSGQKVVHATVDTDITDKSYEVVLQNGTKLEFDKKGNLKEIDCKQGSVPAKLVPQAISNYINSTYPGQLIRKIDFQKKEYEVELSNGIDITFNKKFQVVEID